MKQKNPNLPHDTQPGRVCPSCEEWFPEHEFTQDWRKHIPEDATFRDEDGKVSSVALACSYCVDYYFDADAPCVQRCADGSYAPA